MDIAHIRYTWEHKKAFLAVEKQLLGHNTLRGYLHDFDKIIGYLFFDAQTMHKFHRKHSRHHSIKARTEADFTQMIIDWECARLTKPDKPLNARETLQAYYPELSNKIEPLLYRYGL